MPNDYHHLQTGADLHPSKIDPITGTELTASSQTIYDARWAAKPWISVGPASANDYQTTGTADYAKINSAIASAFAAGGGTVLLNGHNFYGSTRITPKTGVRVLGLGKGLTNLIGGVAFDYVFYNSATISGFELHDLTIDSQNADHASGIALQYASNCLLDKVAFKNVAAGGWHLKLGVTNGVTDGILNLNNRFIDCDFDGHQGSLEMLLLFNCRNTWSFVRPFKIRPASGPRSDSGRSATTPTSSSRRSKTSWAAVSTTA